MVCSTFLWNSIWTSLKKHFLKLKLWIHLHKNSTFLLHFDVRIQILVEFWESENVIFRGWRHEILVWISLIQVLELFAFVFAGKTNKKRFQSKYKYQAKQEKKERNIWMKIQMHKIWQTLKTLIPDSVVFYLFFSSQMI